LDKYSNLGNAAYIACDHSSAQRSNWLSDKSIWLAFWGLITATSWNYSFRNHTFCSM